MNHDLIKKANSYGFTVKHEGLVNVIKTKIQIAKPRTMEIIYSDATAIWDTGATVTTISTTLAQKLGLKPVSFTRVNTANGVREAQTYYLSLLLPNRTCFPQIRVSDGEMPCDMLIGMDIISSGDFHISNYNKRTVFTFRMPSLGEEDYERDQKLAQVCATKSKKKK